MNGLQLSIPQRMALLKIVLVFSLIICIFLSFNLWGGTRTFPAAPVFGNNPVPPPFDFIFIGLAIICWLLSLVLKGDKGFILTAFVLCCFLALFDVNRLQPWFYLFNAMLLIYIFHKGRADDANRYTSFFILLQIMFASIYFFSGLSQLNPHFIERSFIRLILPLNGLVSSRQFTFLTRVGALSPYLLMFTGLGLVISPLRYLAFTIALGIHFLLLIFLFPSEDHLNYALWFSNLLFMVMLFLLFSGKTKQRYFSPTFLFQQPLFYGVMLLFVVLPLFNLVNEWPDFLSFNFKSGNNKSAMIQIKKTGVSKLPLYERNFCIAIDPSTCILDYKRWINHELHADYYPSETVFNSIYRQLKEVPGVDVKEIELSLEPKLKLLCKP